jgi:RecA-family ATPase
MDLNSITLADFIEMKLPPRRYIIDPFLPERGLVEIYARTGIGKTTFAMSVAMAAATGKHFQKWAVHQKWNVLYIDGEMSATEMQSRAQAAAQYFGCGANNIENFRLICHDLEDGLPDIGNDEGQDWFEKDVQWANIIFLDNISCLWWSGRENDADAWSVIQQWLLRLRAAGKSIVMLHHSGKNGSSRGSSRRHDVLDTVIKLDRPFNYTQQEGAKFEVHFEKSRGFTGDAADPVGLCHTIVDGISCWESFSIGTEKAQEVASLLRSGANQNEIASKLGISQPEVSRRKQLAAAKGLL